MSWQPLHRTDGILDLSHNNGAVDWKQVPAEHPLVFLKASQGQTFQDPAFSVNHFEAIGAGKLVAPYHFLTAEPPAEQLSLFQRVANLSPGAAAAVDWEPDPRTGHRAPIEVMEAFCAGLQQLLGRPPLAYHGMFDLSSPKINSCPWWIPKYGPEPKGPKWLFWQYSPQRRVLGVPGLVDVSRFAGTLEELKVWHRDGRMPEGFQASGEKEKER